MTGPLLVIVEYAPFGNLREFLRDRRPADLNYASSPCQNRNVEHVTEQELISFAFQVARGMDYLASKKVIPSCCAVGRYLIM